MAALINAVYPSYNDTSNYSGVNSAIKSGGLVTNPEQYDTVIGLERSGQLGLSQFGLIKLPREVLMLQDERSAKVKSPNVSSSTQTTSDEDRQLNKVEDNTASSVSAAVSKKNPKDKQSPADPAAANSGGQAEDPAAADNASSTLIAQKDSRKTADQTPAFAAQTDAFTAAAHASEAQAQRRKEDNNRRAPTPQTPKAPNILGRGNSVYLGVISSSSPHLAGRNLSVLA